VVLPVTFGETRENYRTEYIKFEVADFETSYHAILGRPAIAKFKAVPHCTYLVLKMPSPVGVLSLQGDMKISFDCDTEAVELAATNQVANAMMEIYAASKKLSPSELDIPKKSDNANKTTTIGAGLDRNRKTRSAASSGLTETSSRGNQRTCQGCPGIRSSTHFMSTLKLPRSDNTSAASPTIDGKPSRRNSPKYS
jgi:hypothetical protein